MKVLIADDNRDILETTQLVLELEGHEVLTASQAEDIEPLVRQHRPDLLLQDLNMPRLDLQDLLRSLRAGPDGERLAILIFSAALPDVDDLEDWGADGFISKPFDVQALRQRVRSFAQG